MILIKFIAKQESTVSYYSTSSQKENKLILYYNIWLKRNI